MQQGNIKPTVNAGYVALAGEVYFTLSDNGAIVYSRSGAFGTDDNGYVVNAAGQRLQVFPRTSNGGFDTAQLGDLQLSSSTNPPKASTSISANLNLPSTDEAPATTPFEDRKSTRLNSSH